MKSEKVKITVFVEEEVWNKSILQLNKMPGVRRDEVLNLWLESSLDDLKGEPVNTLEKDVYKLYVAEDIPRNRKKVNITLNKGVLTKLDAILQDRNVPRSLFLAVFLKDLEGAIAQLEHAFDDPFSNNELYHGGRLYKKIFPTKRQADDFKQGYEELISWAKEGKNV